VEIGNAGRRAGGTGATAISPARFGDREPHALPVSEAAPASGDGFRRLWEDYARAIAGGPPAESGAPTRVTPEDGRRAVEIILAAYESARTRRAVALPPRDPAVR
jgi:predicted dehydrogenase